MILYFHAENNISIYSESEYLGNTYCGNLKTVFTGRKTFTFMPDCSETSYMPVTLTFSDNTAPPSNTDVTLIEIPDGYIVSLHPQVIAGGFFEYRKVLYSRIILSVKGINEIKITVGEKGGEVLTLSDLITPVEAKCEEALIDGINTVVLKISHSEGMRLYIFAFGAKPILLFKKDIRSYEISGGKLSTVTESGNLLGYGLSTKWKLTKEFTPEKCEIERPSSRKYEDKFLPLAFTEIFLLGGDAREYLSDSLYARISDLKEFFGDYSLVIPPPEYKPYEVLLCYKKDYRRYYTARYCFAVENGIITGLFKY